MDLQCISSDEPPFATVGGALDTGTTPSFKDAVGCPASKAFSRPVVLELCAGSARLSAALATATDGFTSNAVDYEGNRHKSWHHVIDLVLRLSLPWELLRRIVLTHNVIFVHIAPPCGTSSRARAPGVFIILGTGATKEH